MLVVLITNNTYHLIIDFSNILLYFIVIPVSNQDNSALIYIKILSIFLFRVK